MRVSVLLVLVSTVFASHVPQHIRQRFGKMRTLGDVMHTFVDVKHASPKPMAIQKPATNIHIKPAGIGHHRKSKPAQSAVVSDSTAHDVVPEDMSETSVLLREMEHVQQGEDTCSLQKVCVPVPLYDIDPRVLIYPKCYEMMQCIGGCCNVEDSCRPQSVRLVQKLVVEFLYMGESKMQVNRTFNVTMEEHISCSCLNCPAQSPTCAPGFQLGPDCACECANGEDAQNCQGQSRWDESRCECRCDVRCPRGQHVNRETCTCTTQPLQQKSNHYALLNSLVEPLPPLQAKVDRT